MTGRQRKILVIDDDESTRSMCEEVLSVAGYEVDTASSAQDGAELLKNSRYDLIVSEVSMPGVEKEGFHSVLMRDFPVMKDRSLFLSGELTPELVSSSSRQGVRLLKKPFRIAEFLKAVEDLMARPLVEFHISGEAGKRQEARFALSVKCDIFDDDPGASRYLRGRSENVSRWGVKVVYEGEPVQEGASVSAYLSLSSFSLHRAGRVIWSTHLNASQCASGLKLDEPVPVSAIVNIIPARVCRLYGKA